MGSSPSYFERPGRIMTHKTWGGRFTSDTDKRVESFTESISFDHRLVEQDVTASQAHARMLGETGLLTPAEANQIIEALEEIRGEFRRGAITLRPELEDVHTHVERALIERLGDLGRKLHTGRSRNDQVATDLKLWIRAAIERIDAQLHALQGVLVTRAEGEPGLVLPGYTHLQRAQPVLAAHYLLAYVEKFQRDRERLADCRRRLNALPLGAAALAGTSLPIDRESVRQQLGFDALAMNSLDVSSDRDFVLEFVFALSVVAVHLSSWAEEWILWTTVEFGFLQLPDAFCTGSSIMPHKKNPDVLELVRGKTARVIGALQQLFVLLKGLPLAYNRDLQEDKTALFDAFETVTACLGVATPLIEQTRFCHERIAARLEDGFLDATTLMEHCILQGMPMRTAHEAVGRLVRLCEERGCRLTDLRREDFDAIQPELGGGIARVLGVANCLRAFRSVGSTAPAEVAKQVRAWRERLEKLDKN